MEGEAGARSKVDNYPLTVFRTAKEHSVPLVAAKTPVTALSSDSGAKGARGGPDHVTSKDTNSSNSSSSKGQSRFYFESDALALKNNPE